MSGASPTVTVLATGLHAPIGCKYRRSRNQLVFVEFNGNISALDLVRPVLTTISTGSASLNLGDHINLETGAIATTGGDVSWDQFTRPIFLEKTPTLPDPPPASAPKATVQSSVTATQPTVVTAATLEHPVGIPIPPFPHRTDRDLDPQGTAQLAYIGQVDFASVTPVQLQSLTYTNGGLRLFSSGPDSPLHHLSFATPFVFGVKTNGGHYAKVEVRQTPIFFRSPTLPIPFPRPTALTLTWTTYNIGPAYHVLGSGYGNLEDIVLSDDENTACISERGGNVYHVDLSNANRSAPSTRVVNTTPLMAPHQMALNDPAGQLYLVEFGPSGHLWRMNVGDGSRTAITSGLTNAVGLALTHDFATAFVGEQLPGGGQVSRVNVTTGARSVIASGLTAPFFMTWLDDSQTAILITERDPANRVTLLRLSATTATTEVVAPSVPFRPSSVAVFAPGRLLVCSNDVISEVDLASGVFSPTGPIFMGIGNIPLTAIRPADGLADTSALTGYFFQVAGVPFSGSMQIRINHDGAYNAGARFYKISIDGVLMTDSWVDLLWSVPLNTWVATTVAATGGFFAVRTPFDLWYNHTLGGFVNASALTSARHTIMVEAFTDTVSAAVYSASVSLLVDNNPCSATISLPTITVGGGAPVTAGAECGLLDYGSAGTPPAPEGTVTIGFTASQPNGFGNYSFGMIRGVNGLPAQSRAGAVSVSTSVTPSVSELLGTCRIAGFAANIYAASTATTGTERAGGLDASAEIAFVLAPEGV